MGCASNKQLERVGQNIDDRFERFNRPLGRPGDIEYEALTDSPGDPA